MDLLGKIEEIISKQNIDWFNQKEVEFKSHPLFNNVDEQIILVDYHIKFEFASYSDKIELQKNNLYSPSKIDLRAFCYSYLPISEKTYWGLFPDPAIGLHTYNNTLAYCLEIVEIVFNSLPKNATAYESSTFILKIIQEVRRMIDKMRVEKNKIYNEVLDDVVVMIEINLNNKFKKEIEFAELISRYEDHLDFKLNQEQLVSLIYFIYKADFFNYSGRQFLKFCFKNFRFTNQREKYEITPFSDLKAIQSKFSEITISDSERKKAYSKVSSLEHVEDELRKVFLRRK